MGSSEVVVFQTGIANTASVRAGLERLGAAVVVTNERERIIEAQKLVVPGVGAFGPGMEELQRRGLIEPLRERIQNNLPTIGMCLGFQLFCQGSEESPETEGIAVLDVEVERFPNSVKVPQIGWNKIIPSDNSVFVKEGYAYFANSYCIRKAPSGWTPAYCSHGIEFVAALERGNILLCQFHPELSGAWGKELLQNWLQI